MTNNVSTPSFSTGIEGLQIYLHGDLQVEREKGLANDISEILKRNGCEVKRALNEGARVDLGYSAVAIENYKKSHSSLAKSSDIIISIQGKQNSNEYIVESVDIQADWISGKVLWLLIFDSTEDEIGVPGNSLHYYAAGNKATNVVAKEVVTLLKRMLLEEKEAERRKFARAQIQEIIERKVDDYVKPTIDELDSEKTLYRWLAGACYFGGFICLLLGVMFTFMTVRETTTIPQQEWIKLCIVGVKTAFTLAIAFACSRYAFHIANSFMDEALRSAERIHAIRFGDLYLKVYGDKVEWEQIKEAFQNWNIDRKSPFGSMNADNYDPKLLDKAMELAKLGIEKGAGKGD